MKLLYSSFYPSYTLADYLSSVEIIDKDDNISLLFPLPGFKTYDIHVDVFNGVLSVKAENKRNNMHYRYRLSGDINTDKIAAKLEDGILTVSLPRLSEEEIPKKVIEVTS